ncbi:MAG: DUF1624 domain-containing protein [Myxococcales bacterium]|nr:DUF1624 domain-containing protein [Myxococcales bacterium]
MAPADPIGEPAAPPAVAGSDDAGPRPGPRERGANARGAARRLAFVDDLRGLAVLLMIVWHTADGWLAPASRAGAGYEALRVAGGLAAPLFFLLAGASVVLKLESGRRRGRPARGTQAEIALRGLSIMALGYGLRLQMWLVDAGAVAQVGAARAFVPLVLGIALVVLGLRAALSGRAGALWRRVAPGVALWGVGLWQATQVAPGRVEGLLRVDVLQAIGACLVLLALGERAVGLCRRGLAALALALLVVATTPALEATLPSVIPWPVAAYVARWPSPGARPVAMFPLFPWAAYALAGVAVGRVVAWARRRDRLAEASTGLVLAGATLAVALHSGAPDLVPLAGAAAPVRAIAGLGYKLGWCLALLGGSYALARTWRPRTLQRLGRHSLLAYWWHLELAFGLAATPVRSRLGLGAVLVGATAVVALMGWLATLAEGAVGGRLRAIEQRLAPRVPHGRAAGSG